jgi:hypothetical protein
MIVPLNFSTYLEYAWNVRAHANNVLLMNLIVLVAL